MKPHRTDGVSLSFGLIFMAIVLWWAVSRVMDLRLPAVGWMVAGSLILFGVLGLLSAIRSGRSAERQQPVRAAGEVPPSGDLPGKLPGDMPGDLPPEVHARIVRELLENPADRLPPVTAPPAYVDPGERRRD